MRISLESAPARWSFAIAVLLISLGFAYIALKVWVAESQSRSSNPRDWLRAAKLEPGNARYWRQLGLAAELSLRHPNDGQAVTDLKRAAALDPRSADIWTDLAQAYERMGEVARAKSAYQRAQSDYPISSNVAWLYGSFLLRQGDLTAGYAQIRRALAVDPSLTTSAVAECWEAGHDASSVADAVLPSSNRYYFTALSYFLSAKQDGAARTIWNALLKLGQPIPMDQANSLVNQLIGDQHLRQAQAVWRQALDRAPWPLEPRQGDSLVFNGGFEQPVANGGFGWREGGVSGVRYHLDGRIAHSGKQSLRVTFDGRTNLDFAGLLQFVPAKANQHYQFVAYLRTENITTDSGVRFLIYDPNHPSVPQILTPNMVGTNGWTAVDANVTSGLDTDLLVIALRRIPSQKFDNKLAGTAWVDDVSLVPVEGAASAKKLALQ